MKQTKLRYSTQDRFGSYNLVTSFLVTFEKKRAKFFQWLWRCQWRLLFAPWANYGRIGSNVQYNNDKKSQQYCLWVAPSQKLETVTTRIITFLVGNPYKPSFSHCYCEGATSKQYCHVYNQPLRYIAGPHRTDSRKNVPSIFRVASLVKEKMWICPAVVVNMAILENVPPHMPKQKSSY